MGRGWIVLLLLLLSWPPAPTAGEVLPLDRYWQQIESLHAQVIALQGSPEEAVREQLEQAAAFWEQVGGVELPDGQVVSLSHGYLVSLLRADPPDLERLERFLDGLLVLREEWLQGEHGPEALAALEPILAGMEVSPDATAGWWERFLEWLDEVLSPPQVFSSEGVRWLLILLGSALLGVALVYAARSLKQGLAAEVELRVEEEEGLSLSAAEAMTQARTLAGGGDYRMAVRYLYLSALLLLEERGLLQYDRTQTNQEYIVGLASSPRLRDLLREVVVIFERVWYGCQVPEEAEFARYVERVEALRRVR